MPCACLLPPEIYPDASEWGPLLWTILHGMMERAGKGLIPMYIQDERRALIHFFKALGKMIPCPSCKEHYDVYLKEHPVEKEFLVIPYSELNAAAKRWFWELHNWVNESHGKPIFPYEDLTPRYKNTNIRAVLKSFDVPMKRAIRVRGGQYVGYQEFLKWTLMLCSIYGL